MLYCHISNVPYSQRQSFEVTQYGPNRYHAKVTQGGQFICLTIGNVYGGYHQGFREAHYACTSERAAKRIFNQMKVFGYKGAMRYLSQSGIKAIPVNEYSEKYKEYLKGIGLFDLKE